jgi:hypothetical protein
MRSDSRPVITWFEAIFTPWEVGGLLKPAQESEAPLASSRPSNYTQAWRTKWPKCLLE